jgi:protein-S-isoprenylcysteine O-methyltransferase Ste14
MATLAMLPLSDVPDAVKIAALVLGFVGAALSTYVLLYLGRSFSIMAQARKLVTSGPYSVVRHPLYIVEEIAIIGIILAHFSIWAVAIGTVHWLFQMRRMLNEERVLRAAFPEYDLYAISVPMLVPLSLPHSQKAG